MRTLILTACVAGAVTGVDTRASDCTATSTGLIPITELHQQLYLGRFQGGLYPGGANTAPADHVEAGIARAREIVPLDTLGRPDSHGAYVLLSIGMSNAAQEFCCDALTFTGQAAASPRVNHEHLEIVNGARGGAPAEAWDDPTDPDYDRVRDFWLAPRALAESQVVAVWLKTANPQPSTSLPDPNADAFRLLGQLGEIARALSVRYPNIQALFVSSRSYAGYADTSLNPEPFAYESAFAAKWLIEAQIRQARGEGIDPIAGDLDLTSVPWIGWGPYLWADGLVARDDGLVWTCDDFRNDGTHPSDSGRKKVGSMLLDFMLDSPVASLWFSSSAPPPCKGDTDGDSDTDVFDFVRLQRSFGSTVPSGTLGDLDADGDVDVLDLSIFLSDFGCGL